jgi:hypothetical protein
MPSGDQVIIGYALQRCRIAEGLDEISLDAFRPPFGLRRTFYTGVTKSFDSGDPGFRTIGGAERQSLPPIQSRGAGSSAKIFPVRASTSSATDLPLL